MSKPKVNLISDYIKSQSRNKIVIHQDDIPATVPVNIGQILSEAIFNFKEAGKLPTRIMMELDKILHSSVTQHEEYENCLCISNLGILFEPELKLDFSRLLDNYSQNNVLFVKWDGEIDSDNIYFLSRESGVNIDLKNLSHIVI